jgi:ribosomal protein S18 acetylase RimI-like enzyme
MKEHPSSFVLFAETGLQIVGMAVCFIGFSTFRGKKLVNVHDLIILPSSRGLGLGRKLMKAVELVAREIDCCKITLEVRQDNHIAQSLYIGEGYAGSQPPMLFWSKNLD